MAGAKETPAETALLAACKTGSPVILGGAVPEANTPEVRIRAGLIRYLLLGGCEAHRPHPKGVDVVGAWIDGALDFEGCRTGLDLSLQRCCFPEKPVLRDARLGALYLTGSRAAAGVDLHRLETERNVHLRSGFHCKGLADLGGARIGGQLACDGGRFEAGSGARALIGDALTVGTDVFLRDGFHATGEVNLNGAQIGGQLACDGGRFEAAGSGALALNGNAMTVGADVFLRDDLHAKGEVSLVRARIGGQLSCIGGRFEAGSGGRALNGEAMTVGADVFLYPDAAGRPFRCDGPLDFRRARIEGNLTVVKAAISGEVDFEALKVGETLTWRGVTGDIAALDLTDATAGKLRDDVQSWQAVTAYRLDDFRPERIEDGLSLDERVTWLDRAESPALEVPARGPFVVPAGTREFDPQPWTHIARTYDAEGRRMAAAHLRYEREKRVRRVEYLRRLARLGGAWAAPLAVLHKGMRGLELGFDALAGYGQKAHRALFYAAVTVLLAVGFFAMAYHKGQMAPNSDVVLTSQAWLEAVKNGCPVAGAERYSAAVAAGCEMPLRLWEATPDYRDYESFSALGYGFDLFIPLDALGQEAAWAPSKDRGWLGLVGFWLRWGIQIMGWVLTALGAAVLTGLIGRRE